MAHYAVPLAQGALQAARFLRAERLPEVKRRGSTGRSGFAEACPRRMRFSWRYSPIPSQTVLIPRIPRAAEARLLATNSDRTKNTNPRTKTKGASFVPYR